MTIEEKKLEQVRSQRLLNDYAVLGKYDFFTTIISLDSVERKHLEGLIDHIKELDKFYFGDGSSGISFELYQKLSKMNPLAFHEYTHYIDCTSTLWGMKLLALMDDAYHILSKPVSGDEGQFYKAKKFFDFVRAIRLSNYYTEITEADPNWKPWTHRETIGQKFGHDGHITDDPIAFVTFINDLGEPLARSPISALSILECSATAQETEQEIRLILAIEEEEKQAVEKKRYLDNTLMKTYDKNLTEYTVCAHLLANRINNSDIRYVYNCAGVLCRLVLNFPDKLFEKVVVGSSIDGNVFQNDQEYIQRIYKGIDNKDIGILYYLFCNLISFYEIDLNRSPDKWCTEILSYIGISLDELNKEINKQIHSVQLNIPSIEMAYEAGVSNYKKINWFQAYIDINKLALPPAYLGDGSFVNFFLSEHDNGIENIDLDELFEEMIEYESKLAKFVEACS